MQGVSEENCKGLDYSNVEENLNLHLSTTGSMTVMVSCSMLTLQLMPNDKEGAE